jgi:elongation factor G
VVNVRASLEVARAKVAEAEKTSAALAAAASAAGMKASSSAAAAPAAVDAKEIVLVKERATRLLEIEADESTELTEVKAGNICAIVGLKNTKTGDTLVGLTQPGANKPFLVELPGISVPEPVFFCSVEPSTAAGQKELDKALATLALDDPSLRVELDPESGQTLMKGMGELHLEIIKHRLQQEFGLDVWVGKMLISYRETVADTHEHMYSHNITSSTGVATGASVQISLALVPGLDFSGGDDATATSGSEPVTADCSEYTAPEPGTVEGGDTLIADAAAADAADGGVTLVLDDALATVIEDGVARAASRGPALGAPLTAMSVRVTAVRLFNAGTGVTGASALAAQAGGLTPGQLTAAVSRAVSDALREAGATALEPVMRTEIVCSDDHVGGVLNDLAAKRRGSVRQVLSGGAEDAEGGAAKPSRTSVPDQAVILADTPLSELRDYATALRSITAGGGSFSMEFDQFRPVPQHVVTALQKR